MGRRDSPQDRSVDRRKLLKSIGIAAVGTAGLTGSASATEATVSAEEKERLLDNELVSNLRSELNNPEVSDVSRKNVVKDEDTFTVTTLQTPVGKLVLGEHESKKSAVQFHLESDLKPPETRELPKQYRKLAKTTGAVLILDNDENIVQLREATPDERARLAKETGADKKEALMFYTSTLDGFEVHTKSEDKTASTESDSNEVYLVDTESDGSIESGSARLATESDDVTIQADCETWGDRCLQHISICTGCAALCASVSIGNIPGVVACATCVGGVCHFTLPIACGKLIENCA